MKYWKIQFNEWRDGFGWLQFNEFMECTGIFDEVGNLITNPVGYTPIEFDTLPEWANI